MTDAKTLITSVPRPPIVAVLGHVDHGKTTLLDYIRKTNIAAREHGGITQKIGAYQIKVKSEKAKSEEEKIITFIDTPGHEAFSKMRSRGANVADIALLVVAADDSVKPQTIDSIRQIKAANIPMIVVVNKTDLPGANLDKVKQDLAKHEVQVEGFGGDVPIVSISAKTGQNISQLLELISLVAEMRGFTADPNENLQAYVVETRLDRGRGMVATLIIKQGTLKPGMVLFENDKQIVKVRACFDEFGQPVLEALPSRPVEVLGFTQLPEVGAILSGKEGAAKALPQVSSNKSFEQPDFLKPLTEEVRTLNVIIKAESSGSLEAILTALDNRIKIVTSAVGDITEADILLAKSAGAFVVGFNVKAEKTVEKLAQTEKVVFRIYKIIYELLDELAEVVAGLKEVKAQERELGKGMIIAEFTFSGNRVAGTKVIAGRLAKGDNIKLMRNEEEISRAKIKTLRHGKDDITKAEAGNECGIVFDRKLDFMLGDAIIGVVV